VATSSRWSAMPSVWPSKTRRRPWPRRWDAQRALAGEDWGEPGPLRSRMALHTGSAEERDGDYFGSILNRAARLLAIGLGLQHFAVYENADFDGTAEIWFDSLDGQLAVLTSPTY
jgi:hypothetical protein